MYWGGLEETQPPKKPCMNSRIRSQQAAGRLQAWYSTCQKSQKSWGKIKRKHVFIYIKICSSHVEFHKRQILYDEMLVKNTEKEWNQYSAESENSFEFHDNQTGRDGISSIFQQASGTSSYSWASLSLCPASRSLTGWDHDLLFCSQHGRQHGSCTIIEARVSSGAAPFFTFDNKRLGINIDSAPRPSQILANRPEPNKNFPPHSETCLFLSLSNTLPFPFSQILTRSLTPNPKRGNNAFGKVTQDFSSESSRPRR